MPCNPSVGGLAKKPSGQEVDALGGEIAKNTDKTDSIPDVEHAQSPAVQATRAQVDKHLYRLSMKEVLENQANLDIKQAIVEKILANDGKVIG